MHLKTYDANFGKQHVHFRIRRFFYVLPCFVLFSLFVAVLKPEKTSYETNDLSAQHKGRHTLQIAKDVVPDCIPESIDSFPSDFFTQEQRAKGGIVVHFLILIYLLAMLAVVCDDYFVPSLEIISDKLKLPSDVAGATFMAIGTSSPELFSSIIGAFITEGDIGIGTIVGSAVFNILGVTGLAGIVVWNKQVDVDWYPVVRDSSVYIVTIAALTIFISNNIVTWWESLIMIAMFGMYIVLMYFNSGVEKFSKKHMKQLRQRFRGGCSCCGKYNEEQTPLNGAEQPNYTHEVIEQSSHEKVHDSYSIDISPERKSSQKVQGDIEEAAETVEGSLCSRPKGGWRTVWWVFMWPASLLFYITIPDCRKDHLRKFFVVTFLSATAWLGVLSYLSVWMVTVIGYTFAIPDTVSGLTLLAVGTSLPEILSSVIVVRSGLGNMVMSNVIGSNIFDILFCLGVPWFIKTLTSGDGYLVINSSSLTYTTTTLLVTVFVLVLVFHFSSWKLSRMMGITCLALYIIFISLACMYELNVFGDFNPPPC